MPVICLVRHGQASFGSQEYDALSDLGREQAAVVGAVIARRGLRAPVLACGSLRRQRDTADVVASALGVAADRVGVDDRWNEYDHLELVRRYVTPAPGNETDSRGVQQLLDLALGSWVRDADAGGWAEFAGGAMGALGELSASLGPGRDAVVVTSGGVLAAVCGTLLGVPPAGVVALNRVAVNAAISTLVVGAAGTSLLTFNDHAHFTGERRPLLSYR